MASFFSNSHQLFIAFLLLSTKIRPLASLPASVSDGVFESQVSAGRHLLQAIKSCPVNFEFLDYSNLTSRCKGPNYPPASCCSAYKDLACPYVEFINDLSTDCSSTLFSYINLYGKYPPGLFSSECREGKLGLACPASSPASSLSASTNSSSNGGPRSHHVASSASLVSLLTAPIVFLLYEVL